MELKRGYVGACKDKQGCIGIAKDIEQVVQSWAPFGCPK